MIEEIPQRPSTFYLTFCGLSREIWLSALREQEPIKNNKNYWNSTKNKNNIYLAWGHVSVCIRRGVRNGSKVIWSLNSCPDHDELDDEECSKWKEYTNKMGHYNQGVESRLSGYYKHFCQSHFHHIILYEVLRITTRLPITRITRITNTTRVLVWQVYM